jgi:hypothetical protein
MRDGGYKCVERCLGGDESKSVFIEELVADKDGIIVIE